jgi:hypothetical protein
MAIEWCKHVDGVLIFPKLLVYLREHHKHWLRNQRIQDAVKNMKSEIELLEAINKRETPAELSPTTEGDDSGGLSADNDMEKNGYGEKWPMGTCLAGASISFHARPTDAACDAPPG